MQTRAHLISSTSERLESVATPSLRKLLRKDKASFNGIVKKSEKELDQIYTQITSLEQTALSLGQTDATSTLNDIRQMLFAVRRSCLTTQAATAPFFDGTVRDLFVSIRENLTNSELADSRFPPRIRFLSESACSNVEHAERILDDLLQGKRWLGEEVVTDLLAVADNISTHTSALEQIRSAHDRELDLKKQEYLALAESWNQALHDAGDKIFQVSHACSYHYWPNPEP